MELESIESLRKCVSILYRAEQKYMNQVMDEYRISSSSYIFIVYLSENEGISQRELCRMLSLDSALATRAMTKLEEQGYVIRKKNAQDARAFQLFLSDKGKELAPVLKSTLCQWWKEEIGEVGEAEMALVIRVLERIAKKTEGR